MPKLNDGGSHVAGSLPPEIERETRVQELHLMAYADAWAQEFGDRDAYLAVISVLDAERRTRSYLADFLRAQDLTLSQWTVLTMVHLSGLLDQPITIGGIADLLGVHSTTVTNALDRLESRAWVERVALDGRTVGLSMTKQGARSLSRIQRELVKRRFGLARLDDGAIAQMWEALAPVTGALVTEKIRSPRS